MIINHNLPAMNTYNKLTANNANTSKALEKLSSGLRINRAGDDAAGLAISEKMRGQIRGLDQATRNSQDGISMIQTAEGNLSETQSILQRMKELATQAANDTNVGVDRGEIQKEINQLSSEINRIGNTTEFNTQKLLNGGGDTVEIDPTVVTAGGKKGAVGSFGVLTAGVTEVKGVNTLTVTGLTTGGTITIDGQSFSAVTGTANAALGQVSVDGTNDNRAASLAAAINANSALSDHYTVTLASNVITLTEKAGKATGVNTAAAGTGVAPANTTPSTKEVQGKYTFNLDHAFELNGQTLTIGGVALTAVSGVPGTDQFAISNNSEEQAKSIAAAINANTHIDLGQRFEASANGSQITLTERATKALTAALATPTVSAPADVAGVYNADLKSLVAAGGRITIDNVDIAVTTDSKDSRLATGEAMLAGTTLLDQASNLAAAVNKNDALKIKYSATLTGSQLTLTQQAGMQSSVEPVISTNTTAQEGFKATFQVGANTAQSMSIEIGDMRSNALKVTGTEAGGEVTAKNGVTASYKAVKEVSNGTTNTNTEYALDVSDHEKATAAISVLSDAIENVSAERSKLGAYQNRLEHTITNLTTSSENMSSAESRIRDVDMAKEMMNFQKNNILSQAAQAMLAQANQQPQNILQLLR